jgi:type I restriction enzyme S subunit
MASDWSLKPFEDVCERVSVGHVGPTSEFFCAPDIGVPLVRSQNVRPGLLDLSDVRYVTAAFHAQSRKSQLKAGDILIVRVGHNRGDCCVVPAGIGELNCANIVLARPRPELSGFLGYYFRSSAGQRELLSISSGSAQLVLNTTAIAGLRVPVPEAKEAVAIAHILGTLDDKIELNRKMNETLESMARALFKSWFVDFDPVRAKAEGRQPSGMDAETAKLFPSEFVDSELGEIPKGWRVTTLGTEVDRCGGAVQTGPFGSQLHASDYVPEGIPVVMPKDIGGRRVSTESIARIREEDAVRLSRHRLQPGDIVYSRRGDVERHALIGAREVGWLCGTGCLLVRLGSSWSSPMFASFALDRPETRAWITQHAIGATMPNLNTGILSAVPLVMPPDDVLRAFARAADPLQALVVVRDAEAGLLAGVRDGLLPRLLSGELSVASAEREVEVEA